MTLGWESKPLGELCEVLDSQRRPVTKKDRRPGEYPYYGATGIVDYVDEFIFDGPLVLVGEDGAKWGSGDETAFSVSGRCWVNNHAHVLRPDRTRLLDAWLVHYLVHEDLSRFVSGLTVPKLNQGNLRQIPIPVPPLPEQRRIVAILDEAFEAIATAKSNTEKNLQNAREWAAGQLSALLGTASADGRASALETVVAADCTLSYGIVQPGNDVPGGLPVVRPVDLGGRTVRAEGLKRIDPALARAYARTTLKGGDLLLCVRGTTGTVSVAEQGLAGANVTRGIVPIRFAPQVITQKLGYYLLRSEPVQAQISAKTYGAALMQINIGDLRKIAIAFPPSEKQAALVEQLDAIQEAADQLVESYERKLSAIGELKKSLLHQAFTGQLSAKTTDQQLEAVA